MNRALLVRLSKTVVLSLAVGALLFVLLSRHHRQAPQMVVDYLDVGQGDSILITLPAGFQILVDGGPDQSVLSELRKVMPVRDRNIDLIVSTHGDADHLAGLVDVLKDYEVGLVLQPDAPKNTALYRAWQELLAGRNQPIQSVNGKMDLALPDNAVLHLLHPTPRTYAPGEPANNASIVFRLDYGQTRWLFTGDIEGLIERRLVMTSAADLDSDVLKVPHHGSKTSSSPDFVAAVSPAVSVVQVGAKNRYGHPNVGALDRLKAVESLIWRTDQEGTITLKSDGCRIIGISGETVYNACIKR